jgi:hypothetical protein
MRLTSHAVLFRVQSAWGGAVSLRDIKKSLPSGDYLTGTRASVASRFKNGSVGAKRKLLDKPAVAHFFNELLTITVAHYTSGASKGNVI